MKKRWSTILIVLIFVVGLLVMIYPTVSNWYNEKMSSYVVSNYTQVVDDNDEEYYAQMFEDARAYNEALHSLPKQFISGIAEDEYYINTLDVYDGMMGYIVIDKINLKLPIYHGTDETVLQSGVGHLEGSSLPTGDIGNNTVLTGHTGLPSAELFTYLTEMEVGDTFEIYVLNQVYTYEVYNISVVEPYEVDDLEAIDGKDIVTLITCTPYGVNSHRLLVQGEQVETIVVEDIVVVPETGNEVNEQEKYDYNEYIPIVAGVLGLILLIVVIVLIVKRKRKYRRFRK